MNVPGVPPHKRVDKPSDADFFQAIKDTLPGKKEERETVLAAALAYGAWRLYKNRRGNSKS